MSTQQPIQILNTSPTKPYLFHQYPMRYGSFSPHLFWHVAYPPTKSHPYQEAIYSSSWNYEQEQWARPKQQSIPGATICLLFKDNETLPTSTHRDGLPLIKSIYIDPEPFGKKTTSLEIPYGFDLELNDCNPSPTPQQLYEFAINPNHVFSAAQKDKLFHSLVGNRNARFGSWDAEGQHLMQLWPSSSRIRTGSQPDQEHISPDFPFQPLPANNEVMSDKPTSILKSQKQLYHLKNFPDIAAQPLCPETAQQIYPSKSNPFWVLNFPNYIGQYFPHCFWQEIVEEIPGRRNRKETVYASYWIHSMNSMSLPHVVSKGKCSICSIQIDNHKLSPTYGLPVVSSINVKNPKITPLEIYHFAADPNFVRTRSQRQYLFAHLTHSNTLGAITDQQLQNLLTIWDSQPDIADPY